VNIEVKIGTIRKMASELFQIPFNDLKMKSKTKKYSQSDNRNSLRALGWSHTLNLERSKPNLGNPKTYLAQNQAHINALFVLLSKENTGYVDLVWKLLNSIPTNKEMQEDIKSIELNDEVIKILNKIANMG